MTVARCPLLNIEITIYRDMRVSWQQRGKHVENIQRKIIHILKLSLISWKKVVQQALRSLYRRDFIRRLDCNGFSYEKKFLSVHRSVWICKIFERVSFKYLYLIPFKLSNMKVEASRFRTSTRLVELWLFVQKLQQFHWE